MTRGGRHARRALLLAALLATAACGGGDSDGDAEPATTVADAVPAAGEVPTELEPFGGLARVVDGPEVTTFGGDAATVTLAGGATLNVPAGAFPGPTDVSITVADLDFAQWASNPPSGAVYLLSTADDVALAQPLTLELAAPPGQVGVATLLDGEWRAYTVPDGDSTTIPIDHFSTVGVAVVEPGDGDPEPLDAHPDGEAPAFFLRVCLGTLGSTIEGTPPEYVRLAADIIFSTCVNALIDRLNPTGGYVSTACVGDRIGDDVGIRAAIDLCLASPDEPDGEVTADAAPTTTVAPAPPGTEVPAPVVPADIGPLAWDGDLVLRDGSSLVPVGEQWISLTRTDGTNEFEGAMEIATMGDHRFAVEGQIDPVECTSVLTKRFTGNGTFDADFPNQIVLSGEQEVDVEYDCPVEVAETLDGTKPFEVSLFVTDTGIEGFFEGFEFDLPGVPVAIPA